MRGAFYSSKDWRGHFRAALSRGANRQSDARRPAVPVGLVKARRELAKGVGIGKDGSASNLPPQEVQPQKCLSLRRSTVAILQLASC